MKNHHRYPELEKVDAHMHYNTNRSALLDAAQEDNFRFVSINTDIYFFPSIKEQEHIVLNQQKKFGHRLDFICSFPVTGFNDKHWLDKTIATIKASLNNGAVAVKIWKNIGMELRDKSGKLVMIDDIRLEPLFNFFVNNNIRITGHLGEPRNCWIPLENMTVDQDKKYFAQHPEYHMFLHPEFPSYEQQIEARDNVLKKFPGLIFCGAHFASLEWNVDEIAKRLNMFPNMMVDTAERICHLQYQSLFDYDKVRNFVLKYQDRIIYGTDVIDNGTMTDDNLKEHIKNIWQRHWKYFTTDEMQISPKVHKAFKGLNLPWEVLEKIYFKNAQNFYRLEKINRMAENIIPDKKY
ncbi:MAG: amidohydrolase [Cytophagaceae bacterium]|nr:amidohydrolase [Cytophagaceae bacterium]